MTTLKLFTPGVPFESSRAGQLAGGIVSRLFLSSRFTTFNAVQANEVQAVSDSIRTASCHDHCDREGLEDGQKVFA